MNLNLPKTSIGKITTVGMDKIPTDCAIYKIKNIVFAH